MDNLVTEAPHDSMKSGIRPVYAAGDRAPERLAYDYLLGKRGKNFSEKTLSSMTGPVINFALMVGNTGEDGNSEGQARIISAGRGASGDGAAIRRGRTQGEFDGLGGGSDSTGGMRGAVSPSQRHRGRALVNNGFFVIPEAICSCIRCGWQAGQAVSFTWGETP